VALVIAIIKAVLVILFFMHVKDASRITWIFCISAFLWLVIMLALTFGDYMTRIPVGGNTSASQTGPVAPMPMEGSH
jgi:cytochrome c oxidase subunit 4